jgi:hypothetical protein
MEHVNRQRNPKPPQKRDLQETYIDFIGEIFPASLRTLDRLRMIICHMSTWRSLSKEQKDARKNRLDAKLHNTQEPWTMQMAFYALSGTCIYRSEYTTGSTSSVDPRF